MSADDLKQFNATGDSLRRMRSPYDALFRELGEQFLPYRSRFSKGKDHRNSERANKKMINARPRMALRTLQSGMQSGITSPARPWFRLTPSDPELRQNSAVKDHFAVAQREMRQLMSTSGLYTMLHTLWADLGLYGYDAAILEDDAEHGLFGQALVPGEAWIGANARGLVDTLYREVNFTVKQVVSKFVFGNDPTATPDWSKVTPAVKKMWDDSNLSALVPTRHLIMPRHDRAIGSGLAKDKPVMSVYWEEGASSELMGNLGYDVNPILASRWDVQGTDTYGTSPAMDAMPDAKELQRKERDKAEAIRRMNRPPMNLSTEMRNNPFSLMPEAVNYMADPTKGAVPAYQVTPRIQELIQDIESSEERVNEAMYANLFMMVANMNRRQVTAREIDERHEEKLLGLGPVLERQHREKLAVLIRRVYDKVVDRGRVPPLPEEFDGVDVRVEYISTLGQAQKAVATGGLERLYGFVGNISAADGSVLDKVDNDKAVDEYADMIGVSSSIVRSDDEVEAIRQQRAEQAQAQQAADRAEQMANTAGAGAQAAKVLSETDAPRGQGSSGLLADLGLTR